MKKHFTLALISITLLLGGTWHGPAMAQDGGGSDLIIGGGEEDISTGLPRENVRGGALGLRAPGNRVGAGLQRHGAYQQNSLDNFGGGNFNNEPDPRPAQDLLLTFLSTLFAALTAFFNGLGASPTTQPA